MAADICTPPAVNAAGDLDGSPKAGQGVCTVSHHLQRAVKAHQAFCEYRDAGLLRSADRQRAAALNACWLWLESL